MPGFKNYKEGRLQVSVHNKLTVEKLRRQSSCGTVIWLSITELGILEDPDRKRNRVTLIAVISSLLPPDLPELSAELETVRQQFSPADSHLDHLFLLLNDSVTSAESLEVLTRDRLGLEMSRYNTRDLAMLTNSGVEYQVEENDNVITTMKQDKRFCNIFEIGFRTREELEEHNRSKKCQKAKLYKYYQLNKSKLLKSSHELGLEIEVVDQDPGVEVGREEEGVVTIVAKPREQKTFKIKLRNARPPEAPEELDRRQPKGIILDRFGVYGSQAEQFQFEDDKGLVRGTKLRLKYDKKMRVTVRAKSDQIGHYRVPVLIGFYHEVHSQTQYDNEGHEAHVLHHLGLELLLKVQTEEMRELRPRAPFVANKRVRPWRVNSTVRGIKPVVDNSLDHLPRALPLEQYNISGVRSKILNNDLQESESADQAEKAELDKCLELLEAPLTQEKYSQRWQLLLHCEEKQLQTDIRHYDMSGATLSKLNNLFSLTVPGLEENRPSVMKGDKILVKLPSDSRDYEGFVHEIQEQRVMISFGPQFQSNFVRNMRFDVRFTLSRFPLRNMHRAVCLAGSSVGRLFPDQAQLSPHFTLPEVRCFNRNIEGNPQQLSAVKHILASSSGSCPYLVFGPPGTGKTVTLVEAIKQLVRVDAGRNVHILASAPSNTAADLITERLLQHVNKREILRVHATSRVVSNISSRVLEVSNVMGERIFYPKLEELLKYKVIVTTLVTAGRLVTAKIPSDHFSHVVLDETGQATEPEAAVALSGLLGSAANLVMAGDPKQLGPVIRSVIAGKHGLNISLLERLMETVKMYGRDVTGHYDSRCITKLLKNFRSHPNLLTVPKQLFYNNELDACADPVSQSTAKYCRFKNSRSGRH